MILLGVGVLLGAGSVASWILVSSWTRKRRRRRRQYAAIARVEGRSER